MAGFGGVNGILPTILLFLLLNDITGFAKFFNIGLLNGGIIGFGGENGLTLITGSAFGGFGFTGVGGLRLAKAFWNNGVKVIGLKGINGIFEFAVAELGTPIFGVALGYFFLTMTPSLWQILGLAMISGGLVLVYKEKQVVYDQ